MGIKLGFKESAKTGGTPAQQRPGTTPIGQKPGPGAGGPASNRVV